MNEEGFKQTCIKEKKKRGDIHEPFYGTWVADFTLRQDAGSFMLGKYLSDKKIPWQRRRRLGMVVVGNTPTASFLTKIGQTQSAGCRLCKIAREARGQSTDSLADETHGHINSAGCEGMATTVTAAHHSTARPRRRGEGRGEEPPLANTTMFVLKIYLCISAFCLDEGDC